MMKESSPVAIARRDYQAPNWRITKTDLTFELDPNLTKVTSVLHLDRAGDQAGEGALQLDGSELELVSVHVDGTVLDDSTYTVSDDGLQVHSLPDHCQLQIVTQIMPIENTALEGLYSSSGHLTTQCEAEGFRKITYYLDRPDVLSVFTVSIIADKKNYPVLLSNGNFVSEEALDDGLHKVVWHDPFPKPCYLFALVAGKLSRIEDTFTTRSNRVVDLHIYVEKHNLDQCDFAMDALKRSMKWDEEVYGLEYDLDLFMIVAVDDFNAGAMENKGLNIFNSKFVLANRELATDTDFLGVEAVIAHEYFHNWTGNRVTCRDWFQLSLKEGLTVFRDQQFSADMRSAEVKRIQDVKLLRSHQFAEDASPMSHPIRPDEYIEINNFYTLTVYEKGAEVIRMIHTLLGDENYYKGIDLYFERFDGQAVTCDDFVKAMQDASGIDLGRFRQWYSQSGTPSLSVTDSYDEGKSLYSLHVKQQNNDRSGAPREPLHIPLRVGLYDNKGAGVKLKGYNNELNALLHVTESEQSFEFNDVESKPVPSLLQGFCAPVVLTYDYSDTDLALLLANDTDSFNRWEAGQRLAMRIIETQLSEQACSPSNARIDIPDSFLNAFEPLLNDTSLDAGLKSLVLQMPGVSTVSNNQQSIDIHAIDRTLQALNTALAQKYEPLLKQWVSETPNREHADAIGARMLANSALQLLSYLPKASWHSLAVSQYNNTQNMTDRVAALGVLCNEPSEETTQSLVDFYKRYAQHKLVIDKWFSLQATAHHESVLQDIKRLSLHDAFSIQNPNRLRSVVGSFANGNPVYFHSSDGAGYAFVADAIIQLNSLNPQVAARLVTPFLQWRRYIDPQQTLMGEQLERIAAEKALSPAVFELVGKALGDS